ncbi:Prepilin-type N-terminal cleavage/methylation domain-containing protein [uncultured Thiomicrorhabdus sp.]
MESLKMKRNAQKGFTLVEIAIVLVIIGLLLGGVLKGQELIENAKVKSIGKDMENMTAAYYSYKDRKTIYPDASNDDAFWFALKDEGFISGELGDSTDSDGPTHAFDGVYNAVVGGGTILVNNKAYVCANNIDAEIAKNLDLNYDDGVYDSGTWRSVTNATVPADADGGNYATVIAAQGSLALCKEL